MTKHTSKLVYRFRTPNRIMHIIFLRYVIPYVIWRETLIVFLFVNLRKCQAPSNYVLFIVDFVRLLFGFGWMWMKYQHSFRLKPSRFDHATNAWHTQIVAIIMFSTIIYWHMRPIRKHLLASISAMNWMRLFHLPKRWAQLVVRFLMWFTIHLLLIHALSTKQKPFHSFLFLVLLIF